MQDLIMALDARESEINAYLADNKAEREAIMCRLGELDDGAANAEEDLRRINKARAALRNPSEEKMQLDDLRSQMVPCEASTRAVPQYFPPTRK